LGKLAAGPTLRRVRARIQLWGWDFATFGLIFQRHWRHSDTFAMPVQVGRHSGVIPRWNIAEQHHTSAQSREIANGSCSINKTMHIAMPVVSLSQSSRRYYAASSSTKAGF